LFSPPTFAPISLLSKEAAESGNRLGHAHAAQSFQDPGLSVGYDGLAEVFLILSMTEVIRHLLQGI
jgi:hypothetical protein